MITAEIFMGVRQPQIFLVFFCEIKLILKKMFILLSSVRLESSALMSFRQTLTSGASGLRRFWSKIDCKVQKI